MKSTQITKQLNGPFSVFFVPVFQPLRQLFRKWITSVSALLAGVSIVLTGFLLAENLVILASVNLATLFGSIIVHFILTKRNNDRSKQVKSLKDRLSSEASASRILQGAKLLNNDNGTSLDARLATATRTATNYEAAIVFSLQHTHGALAPSHWSYKGQLNNIDAEFESLTGSSPGASAVRQGSAIALSAKDPQLTSIPAWGTQSGFTQGIVSPIFDGLDTVGVVYALNKKPTLPTLREIEQLELILSFRSTISSDRKGGMFGQRLRTFETVSSSNINNTDPGKTVKNLRVGSFLLNAELAQMELSGTPISLSPTEFLLMHTLASSANMPVSPSILMNACWEEGARPAEQALDVAIFRLRKKLKTLLAHTGLIKTVRGSGYMFDTSSIKVDSAAAAV
tara:strand:- start:16 stop:1206 length:1191 start_codon:yes stop_codon:yes gene_type:complete